MSRAGVNSLSTDARFELENSKICKERLVWSVVGKDGVQDNLLIYLKAWQQQSTLHESMRRALVTGGHHIVARGNALLRGGEYKEFVNVFVSI